MSQSLPSSTIDRGLLLIRLALGLVFTLHGWMKLTVLGVTGTAGFLGQLGVPLPGVNAVVLIALELVGGLMLALGAGTRVVGALLAFSMFVATVAAHGANGFYLPSGYEFTLTLTMVTLAIVLTGAGRYSLDARLFRRQAAVR